MFDLFSEKYLREHIKRLHIIKNRTRKSPESIGNKSTETDSDRPIKCNLCGIGFKNNRQVAGHRVNCALFLRKTDLDEGKAHVTLTSPSEESFIIMPMIRNDKNRSTKLDPPFICVHCGKAYTKKPSLHTHVHLKHSSKKPKTTACEVCGKDVLHIRLHMRQVHLYPEVRPHMCDLCGTCFKKSSALRAHRAIHTGERYPCPVCGRGFTQRGDMRKHAKALHDLVLSSNLNN